MIDNNLLNLLNESGFEQKQQVILAYLLQTTSTSAGLIASKTGIKRPTVYAILNDLIDQGFVNRAIVNKVTHYSIPSQENFCEILKNRLDNNFSKTNNAISKLAKHLNKLSRPQVINNFSISAIESKEEMLKSISKTINKKEGFISIFNPQISINEDTHKIIRSYLKQTAIQKVPIKEIMVSGKQSDWYCKQISNPKHFIKFLPKETNLLSDFIIFTDRVFIFNYIPNEEYSILIKDKYLSLSFKAIFEFLWASL